jgi:hypothetical protein
MGAAHGISEVSNLGKDEQKLASKIVSIVENAPDSRTFNVIWSGKTMNLEQVKGHYIEKFNVEL